jgi:hypothetical protein
MTSHSFFRADPGEPQLTFPLDEAQSCTFCESSEWTWLISIKYAEDGSSQYLPLFFCLCEDCVVLVRNHDEQSLADRIVMHWNDTDRSTALSIIQAMYRRQDRPLVSRADALRS